jgi:hypothetical protein
MVLKVRLIGEQRNFTTIRVVNLIDIICNDIDKNYTKVRHLVVDDLNIVVSVFLYKT